MAGMRYPVAILFALALAAMPASTPAQEDDGRSLMERGAEMFLEGLRRELEPALEDLRDMAGEYGPSMRSFFEEMGPAFMALLDEVKDWSRYEPPEILPNGDIIIRRKPDPDAEPAPDPQQAPDAPPPGGTDL